MGSHATKSASTYTRRAHHAGSWYDDDRPQLSSTLQGFLDNAHVSLGGRLRAVIVPHAGYSYSGPTAAYAYQAIQQELSKSNCPIQTILVLHPSHHVYLENCAISNAHAIQTPAGTLPINDDLRKEILALSPKKIQLMTQTEDEEEHSGEMQYPYLAHILLPNTKSISVLPIMCGSLSTQQETVFGELLAEIMDRPNVLTVVSSDFCHWGSRFRYQPTSSDTMPIHSFIEEMDRKGMNLIEMQQPGAFAEYLKETRNTICGRHAIAVWMRGMDTASSHKLQVQFVQYAQSSPAETMRDSSVSYAAAVAYVPE